MSVQTIKPGCRVLLQEQGEKETLVVFRNDEHTPLLDLSRVECFDITMTTPTTELIRGCNQNADMSKIYSHCSAGCGRSEARTKQRTSETITLGPATHEKEADVAAPPRRSNRQRKSTNFWHKQMASQPLHNVSPEFQQYVTEVVSLGSDIDRNGSAQRFDMQRISTNSCVPDVAKNEDMTVTKDEPSPKASREPERSLNSSNDAAFSGGCENRGLQTVKEGVASSEVPKEIIQSPEPKLKKKRRRRRIRVIPPSLRPKKKPRTKTTGSLHQATQTATLEHVLTQPKDGDDIAKKVAPEAGSTTLTKERTKSPIQNGGESAVGKAQAKPGLQMRAKEKKTRKPKISGNKSIESANALETNEAKSSNISVLYDNEKENEKVLSSVATCKVGNALVESNDPVSPDEGHEFNEEDNTFLADDGLGHVSMRKTDNGNANEQDSKARKGRPRRKKLILKKSSACKRIGVKQKARKTSRTSNGKSIVKRKSKFTAEQCNSEVDSIDSAGADTSSVVEETKSRTTRLLLRPKRKSIETGAVNPKTSSNRQTQKRPIRRHKEPPKSNRFTNKYIPCGNCISCRAGDDCGVCRWCKDKTKFGGKGLLNRLCVQRQCVTPITLRPAAAQEGSLTPKNSFQVGRGAELQPKNAPISSSSVVLVEEMMLHQESRSESRNVFSEKWGLIGDDGMESLSGEGFFDDMSDMEPQEGDAEYLARRQEDRRNFFSSDGFRVIKTGSMTGSLHAVTPDLVPPATAESNNEIGISRASWTVTESGKRLPASSIENTENITTSIIYPSRPREAECEKVFSFPNERESRCVARRSNDFNRTENGLQLSKRLHLPERYRSETQSDDDGASSISQDTYNSLMDIPPPPPPDDFL